jgi:hypothetical protein
LTPGKPASIRRRSRICARSSSRQASADYFERVALLTGELYVSTVLTTDGRNPRIAGNGAFASYETGMGPSLVTRVVRMTPSPTVVADLQTTTVAFDRSGRRLAWLRATGPTDPAATEIVVRDLTGGAEQVWLGPGLQKSGLMWSGDDQSVIFVGGQAADAARNDIYSVRQGSAPVALTDQPGFKSAPVVDARGSHAGVHGRRRRRHSQRAAVAPLAVEGAAVVVAAGLAAQERRTASCRSPTRPREPSRAAR